MKIRYIENGDMILSNKSWFWLILLVSLLLANFIAGGYVMATTRISSWGPNIYIQLPLVLVLGLILARAFTRKCDFYFDSNEKTVRYRVQSLWNEDAGSISITDINRIEIQEGGATDSGDALQRLVIECENKRIPMSVVYTNTINFESIKNDINEWLKKNS